MFPLNRTDPNLTSSFRASSHSNRHNHLPCEINRLPNQSFLKMNDVFKKSVKEKQKISIASGIKSKLSQPSDAI
jgi:hypothetical protein